jgi:tetratricopeptide (TPR) repeat protein
VLATYSKLIMAVLAILTVGACASKNSVPERFRPIDNPFGDSGWQSSEGKNNITFRTKRGEDSVEVEIPHQYDSDLSVPMDAKASAEKERNEKAGVDYSYSDMKPTIADREIASTFNATGTFEDERRRKEIEQGLGLQESDEAPRLDESYLGKMDVVKQLFKSKRFEASLIEIDKMIRDYPTDAKLFEMRGTVLDRLGYRDLALRSWKQSLEFKPDQMALKKIVDKREAQRTVASEKVENK